MEKRRDTVLTRDFNLTIGFLAENRLNDPEKQGEYIEFGVNRVELHVSLQNGSVDLKEGDKLGGDLPLSTSIKMTTTVGDETTKSADYGGEVKVSSKTKESGVDAGLKGNRSKNEKKHHRTGTEETSIKSTVSSNISDKENPYWVFRSDSMLNGHLVDQPLFTARLTRKRKFSCSSSLNVRAEDVEITNLKTSWTDNIPWVELRELKIKKWIADEMSKQGYVDEKVVDIA